MPSSGCTLSVRVHTLPPKGSQHTAAPPRERRRRGRTGVHRVWPPYARPERAARRAQDVPVADAKPADIQDLLGGALFKALYKWMEETGPVYLLPTGARTVLPAFHYL